MKKLFELTPREVANILARHLVDKYPGEVPPMYRPIMSVAITRLSNPPEITSVSIEFVEASREELDQERQTHDQKEGS